MDKTIGEHKKYLEGILHKNKDLFIPNETLSVKVPGRVYPSGRASFKAPYPYTKSMGLVLQGGKGSITFRETWLLGDRRKLVRRTEYSYGLRTSNWLYSFSCDDGEEDSPQPEVYSFRYEQHSIKSTPNRPLHHLHVIHSEPHYYSGKMELDYFMRYIKANFFDESGAWDNKAVWLR